MVGRLGGGTEVEMVYAGSYNLQSTALTTDQMIGDNFRVKEGLRNYNSSLMSLKAQGSHILREITRFTLIGMTWN